MMTAQINDCFSYQNHIFSVAGISEGNLFDPSTLELQPSGVCTACYRGYQVLYALVDHHLVVADLHVNLLQDPENKQFERKPGPVINGVVPEAADEEADFDFFNNHYIGINFHLEYSGGLLLAKDFIKDLYVHMGFHPAWKYKHVLELIFENGVLQAEYDRSNAMAELRERLVQNKDSQQRITSHEEIQKFIERAFDRTYERGI